MHTLWIFGLSEEHARLGPEDDRSVDRGNSGHPVAQVSLSLVHIIRAFTTSAGVLTINRVHSQPPRSHTQ